MISKRWKQFRNEQAQAMVEFALVLPIFLGIVLFILDAGWIAVSATGIRNAKQIVSTVSEALIAEM